MVWWGGANWPTVEANLCMLQVAVEISSDGTVRCIALPPSLSPPPSPTLTVAEIVKVNLQQCNFDVVMETAFPHLLLAHYRNQLLFLFVPEAILALCCRGDQDCSTGERAWLWLDRL